MAQREIEDVIMASPPSPASPAHVVPGDQLPRKKTMKAVKGAGPSRNIDVSFKDVKVVVKKPQTRLRSSSKPQKVLLDNISGFVPSGDMLVILGSSGCGKSTLLRVLANATKANLLVSGQLYFNSLRLRANERREILSYVAQEVPLLGEFTVLETLWYAARLYYGYQNVPVDTIADTINQIIESVGLQSCQNVIVGNLFFRGLSGGQRKRLGVAVELISSPPVIVLDEPTSGLDSASALSMMQTLRQLADLGHTIITTIHQPSSKIWMSLTKILLMTEGKCAYFGSSQHAVSYFADMGYQCPEHFNPADYFSAILSTDFNYDEIKTQSPAEFAAAYETSGLKRMELSLHLDEVDESRKTKMNSKKSRNSARLPGRVVSLLLEVGTKFDNLDDKPESKFTLLMKPSTKQSGFFSSMFTLLARFLKSLYREPGLLLARLVVYVGLGMVLGFTYLNIGYGFTTPKMMARSSVLLGMVGFFSFLSISAIPFILDNRAVMDRERKNGSYTVAAYLAANVLSLIPATLILSLVASIIVVFMCHLNNFGLFFLALWILLFTVECLVQTIACLFSKMEVGISCGIAIFGVLFICSGFFIPVPDMSWAIRWLAYVSPIRYSFRAFMRNEFSEITNTTSLQFPNGTAMLDFFALNDALYESYYLDLLVVFSFGMGYIMSTYVAIRFLH